jgi:hypothetical protein
MTLRDVGMVAGIVLLAGLVGTGPARAQTGSAAVAERRPVELLGHIGAFQAGSDEGSIASGPSFGATLAIPVSRRMAVDVEAQTSEVKHSRRAGDFYRTRRTLIVPSLIFSWGDQTVYGFAGGGLGVEFDSNTTRHSDFRPDFTREEWREVLPGVFELDRSDVGRATSLRAGIGVSAFRRVALRWEVYTAGWNLGARMGVGYRF